MINFSIHYLDNSSLVTLFPHLLLLCAAPCSVERRQNQVIGVDYLTYEKAHPGNI